MSQAVSHSPAYGMRKKQELIPTIRRTSGKAAIPSIPAAREIVFTIVTMIPAKSKNFINPRCKVQQEQHNSLYRQKNFQERQHCLFCQQLYNKSCHTFLLACL